MNRNRKVCVIGLDGVGYYNLKRFLQSLPLAGISKIFYKGYATPTVSIPPYTPNAWTSILTGVNPGKHNIYGFYKIHRPTLRASLATSFDVMYPRIFEMLAMNGLRSIVINVPIVHPINGIVGLNKQIIVSDWASPKQFIYPQHLEEKYREYLLEPPHDWAGVSDIKDYVHKVEEYLLKRMPLYMELLENFEFSLFFIVFSELDWLMHKIPEIISGDRINLIHKVMASIDKFVRKALDVCDLTVLVSDHGFSKVVLNIGINTILARKGLIVYSYRFNPTKLVSRPGTKNKHSNMRVNTHHTSILKEFLMKTVQIFKNIIPEHALHNLIGKVPVSLEIDYNSTKAIMVEPATWGIYVKEKKYINYIISILKDIKFIKKILSNEDVFWGQYVKNGPDIIVIPQRGVWYSSSLHADIIHKSLEGEHEQHALLAFYGTDVYRDDSLHNSKRPMIYDLVPTILAYLGLSLPNDTDGRPVSNVLYANNLGSKRKMNYRSKFYLSRKIKKSLKH